MKVLLKGTFMKEFNTKFIVKHAPKNIINIDDTSADDESDGKPKMFKSFYMNDPINFRRALTSNIHERKSMKRMKQK